MSRVTIGIDIGLTGGIAILVDGALSALYPMPTTPVGVKNKRIVLPEGVVGALQGVAVPLEDCGIYVEHVSSRPGEGVASAFSFGRSLGVIHGVVAGLGGRAEFVHPVVWKRYFDLLKSDKEASRQKASVLAGGDFWFPRKKDHGLAEAYLIALYGHNQFLKKRS